MNRSKKTLALVSFLAQFTICMVNFAMVYHMKFHFGLMPGQIGIATSIYTITYFISCLVLEKPLRNIDRRKKAMLALFGMGLSHLLVLLAENAALIYPLLAFYGIAMSLLWPNMEAWITAGDREEELGSSLSLFNFSWSFGAGLSTMAGGILVEIGSSFAVGCSVLLFVLTSLLLLTIRKPLREKTEKTEEKREIAVSDDIKTIRWISWLGILCSYSCYAIMVNIFPLFAFDHLGFSESLTGFLLLLRGMSSCFSFIILSKCRFWKFSIRTSILSQIFLASVFLLLPHLGSPIALSVLFVLYGFVFALFYEMSIFHGAYNAPNPEKRMVIHEVLINVGMVAGAAIGGIVYQKYSFTFILTAMAACSIILIISESVMLSCMHRGKKAI